MLLPIWVSVLVVGSFLPSETKRALGTQSGTGISGQPALPHRLWHFASFGSTALLASLVARSPRSRILSGLAVIALGVSIELLQSSLSGESTEWWDVRDDTCATVALALVGEVAIVRRYLLKDDRRSLRTGSD